jgi:hypothetical protein
MGKFSGRDSPSLSSASSPHGGVSRRVDLGSPDHLAARQLRAGALAVAGGDLAHRIDVRSADEIGELAMTFNP